MKFYSAKHIYTQSLKKRNFSSWGFPGAQGRGHVSQGHKKSANLFSKKREK